MNLKNFCIGLVAGLGIMTLQQSHAINLTFGNIPADDIVFTGGSNPAREVMFQSSHVGSVIANTWVFTTFNPTGNEALINAIFKIGTITGNSAPLTDLTPGGASITIWDKNNVPLSAKIHWNRIEDTFHNGTHGGSSAGDFFLNTISASLDNFSNYHGADHELYQLAHGVDGSINLSFTFTQPGYTLAQLSTGPVKKTSYSGTLATSSLPDANPTVLLLAMALASLGLLKRGLA